MDVGLSQGHNQTNSPIFPFNHCIIYVEKPVRVQTFPCSTPTKVPPSESVFPNPLNTPTTLEGFDFYVASHKPFCLKLYLFSYNQTVGWDSSITETSILPGREMSGCSLPKAAPSSSRAPKHLLFSFLCFKEYNFILLVVLVIINYSSQSKHVHTKW